MQQPGGSYDDALLADYALKIKEFIPIGPIEVKVRLPKKIRGKNIELRVSNKKINGDIAGGWTSFTIPSLVDHELVIIS